MTEQDRSWGRMGRGAPGPARPIRISIPASVRRAGFLPTPGLVGSIPTPGLVGSLLTPGLVGSLLALALAGCGSGGVVEDPEPLYGEVPIEYPLDLWDADVEGETVLRVRVTETGAVDSVEVLDPSGYPAFDSAAVRGALALQYRPASQDGKRISVWAKVPVQFFKGGDQGGDR